MIRQTNGAPEGWRYYLGNFGLLLGSGIGVVIAFATFCVAIALLALVLRAIF